MIELVSTSRLVFFVLRFVFEVFRLYQWQQTIFEWNPFNDLPSAHDDGSVPPSIGQALEYLYFLSIRLFSQQVAEMIAADFFSSSFSWTSHLGSALCRLFRLPAERFACPSFFLLFICFNELDSLRNRSNLFSLPMAGNFFA